MPEKETLERARRDKRQGKSPSTQAGEFVREEIHHVREGKHGARSTKQAIAIGLSKARRAGVKLPAQGRAKKQRGGGPSRSQTGIRAAARPSKASKNRARGARKALKRAPHRTASRAALSRQATAAARRRSPSERSAAARKAAHTRK